MPGKILRNRWILGTVLALFGVFSVPSIIKSQSANASGQDVKVHLPPNIGSYHNFVLQVGMEDEHLRNGSGDTRRTDYANAIGINADEEQKLLTITLDAYKKEREVDGRWNCYVRERRFELDQMYGPTKTPQILNAIDKGCWNDKLPIWLEMRNRLIDELGQSSFEKVNRYITVRGWVQRKPVVTKDCRVYDSPGPGETAHGGTESQYSMYFHLIAVGSAENEEAVAIGKEPPMQLDIPSRLSEEQRSSLIQLAREADGTFEEDHRQFQSAVQQYEQEHHLMAAPNPWPPDLDRLSSKGFRDVEPYIARLREIVGEEVFHRMDTNFASSCKAGNQLSEAEEQRTQQPGHPESAPVTNLNPAVLQ